MAKLFLSLIFCGFAASAAQVANVQYVHDYIEQSTELTLSPNPAVNPNAAANVPYLTCIIDRLNNIGPYSAASSYCNYSATGQAIDTISVWQAVKDLFNCNNGIGINTINMENGAGQHTCYAIEDVPLDKISGLKCHTNQTLNGMASCCDPNCPSDPTVNKYGIYSMCYDPIADTYSTCSACTDKFRQIYYVEGACTTSVSEPLGPPDILNTVGFVSGGAGGGHCWCRVLDMYGHVGQWVYLDYWPSNCMQNAGRCANLCAREIAGPAYSVANKTLNSTTVGYKMLNFLYDQTIGADLPYLPMPQELLGCLSLAFSCTASDYVKLLVPNVEY
ncbi:MAG: hypothetical protein FWE50_02970 [Alphaproteobacteria bacterium]|nr:hypothetical protein [Alphaproteobacteria bacterium]